MNRSPVEYVQSHGVGTVPDLVHPPNELLTRESAHGVSYESLWCMLRCFGCTRPARSLVLNPCTVIKDMCSELHPVARTHPIAAQAMQNAWIKLAHHLWLNRSRPQMQKWPLRISDRYTGEGGGFLLA